MAKVGSLALDGSFPRDGVSIKTLVVVHPISTNFLRVKMSLNNYLNNDVNETRTDNCEGFLLGRCPTGKQCWPGRHQITARNKWTKEENKTAISCYLKARQERKQRYRKRVHTSMEWDGNVWKWGATSCMPSSKNLQEQKTDRDWDSAIAERDWKSWDSPRNSWYSLRNELWRVELFRNC